MSTIEERVKKIVAEQLGVKEEEVTNSASFVEDLGADSLDTVELVMALEEEFETEIPDIICLSRSFVRSLARSWLVGWLVGLLTGSFVRSIHDRLR